MSTNNPQKKKVVVPVQKPQVAARTTPTATTRKDELVFNKTTYIWMGAGLALIFIGLLLMSGGKMPNPETWDPDIIYGFRRTVLAPVFILAGLAVEIVAIFKR
ncbi:MAG: DUF3098 domain-containing protein [Saprospiraceae bacterium]|nr:DUF3098 domain-containing protein [Saprospiraceae bacterium]